MIDTEFKHPIGDQLSNTICQFDVFVIEFYSSMYMDCLFELDENEYKLNDDSRKLNRGEVSYYRLTSTLEIHRRYERKRPDIRGYQFIVISCKLVIVHPHTLKSPTNLNVSPL